MAWGPWKNKRRMKRRFRKRKANGGVSLAVKRYVKQELKRDIEEKYGLTSYNGIPITQDALGATDAYFCVTDNITVGTADNNNRIGDVLKLRKLYMRFIVQMDQDTTQTRCPIRFLVLRVNDVLDTNNTVGSGLVALYPLSNFYLPGAGAAIGITSSYNHDRYNSRAFTVLHDETWVQENAPNASTQSGVGMRYIDRVINLQKHRVQYISGTADNAKGHILILFQNNANSGVADPPTLYFSAKITYTDS